jgi:dTDP-glucose 4,6-dehydratase
MRKGKLGEVYNVGANNEVKNIDIANRIVDVLEKPASLIKFVDDRLGHDQRYALDCEKIQALGWQPEKNFEEALESTIYWYRENDEWWRKIKQKNKDFQKFYGKYYAKRK